MPKAGIMHSTRPDNKLLRLTKLTIGYLLFSIIISIFYFHIGLVHYKIMPPFATFLTIVFNFLGLIDVFPAIILILIFTLVTGIRFLRSYYDLQIHDLITANISDIFSMSFGIIIANIICLVITFLAIRFAELAWSIARNYFIFRSIREHVD